MPRQRKFQQETAIPLRAPIAAQDFNSAQMLAVGCFLAALISAGHGCYTNSVSNGRGIRMKIYADGESYEDTLYAADDFGYVLGGYAKQFGCEKEFMQVMGAAHGRPAARQSEGRESAPEGETSGAAPPKSLRGSQGR